VGELPAGTVTFLFTDLEGSTRLWEEHPEGMKGALARHDVILRDAVECHGGQVVKSTGDGVHAAFGRAEDAVAAAVDAQRGLVAERWAGTGPLRVRMGLHTGTAETRAGDYFGPALNRAARLTAAGHGGQIVCSQATADLLRDEPTGSVGLVDLGEHRLRDLGRPERLFQVTRSNLASEFPPLRSLDSLPGNLPRQVTTFVGREQETETLGVLVCEGSLVTLTGVGGVGKTRLAVQVAAEVTAEFPDGAWVCELAPVADRGAVWETLAASLGVPRSPGRGADEVVLEYLGPKRMLVVLDNCEHLLDAVARMVDAIAQRCPRVSVLATSREGLALAGEQIVAVPSLGVPAGDADGAALARADAVRLFCDRAHDAKVDFALTGYNAAAVAQLCRRLDGIPLAIELAAARARSLPPEDLVARLDQRFSLLTRGSRAGLERHQTLRNTIDWSYDLLTGIERDGLNRLSVFAGGCDLAAAEAILAAGDLDPADAVDVLSQLVDKSLVVVDDDAGVRYRLLETIRQYARERLEDSGHTSTVRRSHADHYVAVAETAGPHLRSSDQLTWATIVARDTDNFRAALDWAVETPSPDHALRLVAPLLVTGLPIGWTAVDWADTARTIPGAAEHPLFPHVVAFAALRATLRGDLERAAVLAANAQEAQDRLGSRHLWVSMAPATLATFRGDFDQAIHHAEVWLELARPTGDPYEIAPALLMLGSALRPDPDRAIPVLDEAVHMARDAGVASSLSYSLMTLAMTLPLDESARALTLLDEAVEVGTKFGDLHGVANAIAIQGGIAARRGDWRATLRANADAAELQFQVGGSVPFGASFWGAAIAFVKLGYLEPAAVLMGQADPRFADQLDAAEFTETTAWAEAALLEGLGARQLTELKARGAALDTADAVAYLRAESQRALSG
jgi:predicted ATPase/class 3 adenylate cyclase